MNVGMLWFDNDPQLALDVKVERAAVYYQEKYGKSPTVCFVHPSMVSKRSAEGKQNGNMADAPLQKAGLEIRSNQSIRPDHFWIGVNGIKSPTASQ